MNISKTAPKLPMPVMVSTLSSDRLESLRLKLAFSAAGRLCALGITVSQLVGQVRPSKIRPYSRKYS